MDTIHIKDWIPVWEYAKLHGASRQKVYRWIRELKIPPTSVKRESVTVERILIHRDASV